MTIDLPEDIETRLELLAIVSGRSPQFYAREAILEYLDDVEERFLAIDRDRDDGELERSSDSCGA